MTNEIWKSIEGYEDLYVVSDQGRVKALGHGVTHRSEHFMKFSRNPNGYVLVHLTKNGATRTYQLHRLVAKAFIPNPDNKPQIDHIDTDKDNNCVDNLRWCTASENNLNDITRRRKSASKLGENNPNHRNNLVGERLNKFIEANKKRAEQISKAVRQISNGEIIAEFKSVKEAQDTTGINSTNISRCCNLKRETAGGFKWEFIS